MEKIIRTICLFTKNITPTNLAQLNKIANLLTKNKFIIQTKRICLSRYRNNLNCDEFKKQEILVGMGSISFDQANKILPDFLHSKNKSINLDLTHENITTKHVEILFKIIKLAPQNTFNFTYGFNLPASSPYFPSAKFDREGFSIGLQPTNLAESCNSLPQWFEKMKIVWQELYDLLKSIPGFLGIDSSIAPLFSDKSSFMHVINKISGYNFSRSVTTDIYTSISKFIKEANPKPIGLCGLMFPCLEDFELAAEYEAGNFNIERNIFLSLHSGLGVDTYPIAINENCERVVEVLRLIQQLSNKYKKPLSARFVSDGKAKTGEKTNFKNQYLKDIIIKKL